MSVSFESNDLYASCANLLSFTKNLHQALHRTLTDTKSLGAISLDFVLLRPSKQRPALLFTRLNRYKGRSEMNLDAVIEIPKPSKEWEKIHPVHLRYSNISFDVQVKKKVNGETKKIKKQILTDLTGDVLPGCGKTTFLDALADKISSGRLSGEILFNGQPKDKYFHRYAAYVQQFDSFLPTLTVNETLEIAANLGLPPTVSREEIREEIDQVLDELGLKSIKNARVGGGVFSGISGGQRKRLSIGVELISRPSLIFLDEPTTGLDSASAYNVMDKIRNLTRHNCTVLATIHQPSYEMFELFDKLLLLSVGQMVYFGPADASMKFFEMAGYPNPPYSNPADHFLDLINVDFVSDMGEVDIPKIIDSYQKSPLALEYHTRDAKSSPVHYESAYASSAIVQFYILCYRNMLSALRNPLMYWSRIISYMMLGFVMGSLYYEIGYKSSAVQDRVSILFFVCAFLTFMSVAAIPTFLEEKEVFLRERQNGAYRVAPFVLANTVVSMPFIFLAAFFTSLAMYFLIDLNGTEPERFWYFVMFLFLGLYVAESIVVCASAVVSHSLIGIAGVAGVFGVYMLVCGFFVIKDNIPDYWIWMHYISFHTYTFEGFMYNDFNGLQFDNPDPSISERLTGDFILETDFDIPKDGRALCAGILVLMIFIYRSIFYLLLQYYQTGKK